MAQVKVYAGEGNFRIDDEKFEDVLAGCVAYRTDANRADVLAFVLADWAAGEAHQEWLDGASVAEITDWVCVGLLK